MSKPLCAATLVFSFSMPAFAAEPSNLDALALRSESLSVTPIQRTGPDPQLAANLSLWFPLGIGGAALAAGPLGIVVGPPLSGIGHFYAGDPWRGTMWTLGGAAVPTIGVILGLLVGQNFEHNFNNGPYFTTTIGAYAGGILTSLAYIWFASRDAYGTAERQRPL